MQHRTFLEQSLTASAIYAPSLVAAALLVNLDGEWNYGDRVVLNNVEFNGNIVTALVIGFISIALAKAVTIFDAPDQGMPHAIVAIRGYRRAVWLVLRGTLILLTTTVLPFVLVNIMTHHDSRYDMVYVSMENGNSTRIIQVILLELLCTTFWEKLN